ncbi:MAG: mechanosensitive ion channel [Lachnospiraceae bacterium]|nr:mechanosensitive ion channel [Lachnospiraceae bacterium]
MILLSSETVVGAANNAVKEVSGMAAYFEEHLSEIISFGIKVLLAFVIFFIGGKLIEWIRKIVKKSMIRSNTDVGVTQFVDSFLKFGLYIFLIVSIAMKFGVEPASVAALIGSAGIAIGLALQGSLSNLAGGVLILLLKPFVVGDYIIEDGHKNEGTVKEIQIFYTKLSTVDNKIIVIPNGSLANTSLTNATAKDVRRLDIAINISYKADLLKTKEIIEGILKADEKTLKDEELIVFVDQLGEHAIVIAARAWVSMDDYWTTRWRMLERIKLTLDKENIEIAYHQLTVHVEGKEK